MNVGIEPSLQDLDILEGTYGVKVSARGIKESFTRQSGPIIDLDNAPPPQELGQQIRIDMWPTPYPYDLDYDPFSASVT